MSMETFQNVDEWLVSTDVSSVLASSWKEEESGFVGGLDDDSASEGYLTSPCPADGSEYHNVTDTLSSPLQSPMSECWVDINEILPCGNKALDQYFTGDENVLTDAFGIELFSVETDHEQLPEVSISELESLLVMDSVGETAAGSGHLTGYVTLDAGELKTVHDNTVAKFDFVHDDIEEEEPATVSYHVDEDTSSEEDDVRDRTWNYRTARHQSRRRCRRSKSRRHPTAVRNNTTDDRKKQQNKSAATRYREKKRSEEIENEVVCAELEKRNKELRSRVQDMTQEVAVLRKLVVDIFRSANV